MKYCAYHDVMTGKYDCNYATVVNNSIVCTSKECTHGCDYNRDYFIGISEEEDDICLSCPYYNPEAPDCCTYAPDACYYDEDPDKYPF